MTGAARTLHRPEIRVLDDADAVADTAAALILGMVARRPDAVLGLATGRTPLEVYARLRAAAAAGARLGRIRSFNLDEYRGLPPDHPASYRAYMRRELFDPIGLPDDRWHIPDGLGAPEAAADAFEAASRDAGGIDLQLLGIGENGHIGFNEPAASLDSRTREVELAPSTRVANTADFPPGEEPPRTAITMGIATIFEARRLLLLAVGARKAKALAAAPSGPVLPTIPASAIRLHPHATVLADPAAAALLESRGSVRGANHGNAPR